jgi:hypothetical protein
MPYLFELPTTGAASFSDLCADNTGAFASRLADATGARATVRGVLKEVKRSGDQRDFLHVVKVGRPLFCGVGHIWNEIA